VRKSVRSERDLFQVTVLAFVRNKFKESSPFLPKHHAVKTYRGMELQLQAFLTSALDEDELWKRNPGRYLPDMRLSGPQSLSGCGGEENSFPCLK